MKPALRGAVGMLSLGGQGLPVREGVGLLGVREGRGGDLCPHIFLPIVHSSQQAVDACGLCRCCHLMAHGSASTHASPGETTRAGARCLPHPLPVHNDEEDSLSGPPLKHHLQGPGPGLVLGWHSPHSADPNLCRRHCMG